MKLNGIFSYVNRDENFLKIEEKLFSEGEKNNFRSRFSHEICENRTRYNLPQCETSLRRSTLFMCTEDYRTSSSKMKIIM